MKKLLTLITIIFASNIFSYSIIDEFNGKLINNFTARTASMGGANISDGRTVLDAINNPANLSLIENKLQSQFTFTLNKIAEDRKLPLYDSFGGYVNDAVYVSNTHYYQNYFGGVAYNQSFGNMKFSLGLVYNPYLNFDYNYDEDVRNDGSSNDNSYPQIIAINEINNEGSVNAYTCLIATKIDDLPFVKTLSLGLKFSSLKGDCNSETKIIWSDYARQQVSLFELPDYIEKNSRDFDGVEMMFGTNIKINHRVSAGFSFSPETTIDVENFQNGIQSADSEIKIPAKLKLGFTYKPQNVFRTTMNVDIEKINWSNVDSNYDDIFTYSLGIEHNLANKIPLRFGFRYESDPVNTEIALPSFTAGTGFPITENLIFDVSAEFANREFQQEDQFADSYYNDGNYSGSANYESVLWNYRIPADRENKDSINENFLKIMTSITFSW